MSHWHHKHVLFPNPNTDDMVQAVKRQSKVQPVFGVDD